jgi:hypothetical protein
MDKLHPQTWLEQFRGNIIYRTDINRTIVVDGTKVDSLAAFFRVFGEAVNGPEGYFGRNTLAFVDCLSGGFGIVRPFTIRWEDASVSRLALNHDENLKQLKAALELFRGTELESEIVALIEEAQNKRGPQPLRVWWRIFKFIRIFALS